MDRIDAMKVFVTAVDEGSLAGAARRLKRSPTAVSRALSFLEVRLGVELLHRTTRALKLSEAGERYAAVCRRLLTGSGQKRKCSAPLNAVRMTLDSGPSRFRQTMPRQIERIGIASSCSATS
jgi:DNA-binding transcriptional LysR family regulator